MEIWKDIPGYIGIYQVSDTGIVKSLKRYGRKCDIILKSHISTDGYPRCVLFKNGSSYHAKVHVLVAMSFLNHTCSGHTSVVDHINGDKTDNRLSNLRVTSNRDNCNNFNKNRDSMASPLPGVSRYHDGKRWRSRIYINGVEKYLGSFANEIDAHIAYQNELSKIK